MKIKICQHFCMLLFTIMITSLLNAQMTGNPVGSNGTGEWTVSAMGTYMTQQLGNGTSVSRRVLLKSLWGVSPWLDVYCLGGGVQLEMKTNDTNVTDYKGKYRFAYGLGLNVHLVSPQTGGFGIWFGGQALRFPSEGSFFEHQELYSKEFQMAYDWREFQGCLGVVFPFRFMRVYLAGVLWAVQRWDTKQEYLTTEYSKNLIGKVHAEYRSGIWTGGNVGVEFYLPQEYSVSLEILLFNEENYHVMIGLGQKGRFDW